MKKLIPTLVFLTFLLSSCDCVINVDGKVISSRTKLPIANASIVLIDRDITSTSDKNGNFNIGEHTGFCYPVELEIQIEKHKPFRILIENQSDGINYKVKSELEFIEYDSPFYPNPANRGTFIIGTSIDKFSKNFEVKSDSIIIYLDEDNLEKEIHAIQEKF